MVYPISSMKATYFIFFFFMKFVVFIFKLKLIT